ncbi:hypothetical protein MT881_002532 [Enterococcus faecium]|nr:hypothetical protein [Enterococcus faecium]
MKKKIILGFSSMFLIGGVAYATTMDYTTFIPKIVQTKKDVKKKRSYSNNSLSIKNISLKEVSTHKNSNDFSKLIEKKNIDEDLIAKKKTEIGLLSEKLKKTEFKEILQSFGGEQLGVIPNYDKHTGESFDRIGLSETYLRLQKESVNFFEAFFTAFPNVTQQQIEQHFNELIFTATYLSKWYDIKIGDTSLWTLLYFKGEDLTVNKEWTIDSILAFSKELQANNNETLLSKNVPYVLQNTKVYSSFSGKQYFDLIKWFVTKETGSTDYSEWFYNYFNGIIKKDSNLTKEDDVGILNRRDDINSQLPYLLALKPGSNLQLTESYRLLMFTSGKDDQAKILETIKVIKNQEAFFYRTYSKKEDVDSAIGQTSIHGPNKDLLDDTDSYATEYLLPMENFDTHGSAGAIASYQRTVIQAGGYSPYQAAHELAHTMDSLFEANNEYFATYVHYAMNPPAAEINTFADSTDLNIKHSSEFAINKDVNDIKDRDDLINRSRNSEDFIYAMDSAIADVVLEMPITEQVNYIKKIPLDVDSGLPQDLKNPSDQPVNLTVDELKQMNIRGLDDLINNGLVIMEPSDTKNLLFNHSQGHGTPLTYSAYFLADGKYFQHSHRIINTLLAKDGWEAFRTFNFAQNKDWQGDDNEDSRKASINALRAAFGDKHLTYRTLISEKYKENRIKLGKLGLKDMSYANLKNAFKKSMNDFYLIKQNLYRRYLKETDSFQKTAFGYENNQIVKVDSYEKLYNAATANPSSTISITKSFDMPSSAKTIDTFEGHILGNGHTISKGKIKLFSKLNNASIEGLILDKFTISDQTQNTGAIAGEMTNTSLIDTHVINSKITIKNGVKSCVGGLVGQISVSSISASSSQNNKISGQYAGGLIGEGLNWSKISNSYASGEVSGNGTNDLRVGGAVGHFPTGTVRNTYSSVDVKNGDGFIGSTYDLKLINMAAENSLAVGNVDNDRMKFMGDDKNNRLNLNNYELSSTTGKSSSGIAKLNVKTINNEDLTNSDFYKNNLSWDTVKTWGTEKVSKGELPYLRNSDPRNEKNNDELLLFEWVDGISDKNKTITGKINLQSQIEIYDNDKLIGSGKTQSDGTFKIPVKNLIGKDTLKIVAKLNKNIIEKYIEVQGTYPILKGKQNVSIGVGEYNLLPEKLLDSVEDHYGKENLTYTIDSSKVNFGLPGSYKVSVTAKNRLGLSETIDVPITIKDSNNLVFRGYHQQERLRLGLQTDTHMLRLCEDTNMKTVMDSGAGQYLKIDLYNQKGALKKEANLKAEQAPTEMVNQFDQTAYQEGDFLKVTYLMPQKLQFFSEGEIVTPFEKSASEELFVIHNNQLQRLTDQSVQAKNVQATVGTELTESSFVKGIDPMLAQFPVTYEWVKPINPGKIGDQTVQLKVSLGNMWTKELTPTLNYAYDNQISLHCYRNEERFILGLNSVKKEWRLVTDTARTTNLDAVTGDYLSILISSKEGKKKYEARTKAEDLTNVLISQLDHKSYAEGDQLIINHMYAGKIALYYGGKQTLPYGESKKTESFVVKNNQLIRAENSDINVATKEATTTLGQDVKPEDFIAYGDAGLTYQFVQAPNTYQYGTQPVKLRVMNAQGQTKEVETSLTVKHQSEVTISGANTSKERLTLKIDPNNHQMMTVTDPNDQSVFQKGTDQLMKLSVFNANQQLVQQATLSGNEAPQAFAKHLSGLEVQPGSYLQLTNTQPVTTDLYQEGTHIETNTTNVFYRVNEHWQLDTVRGVQPTLNMKNERVTYLQDAAVDETKLLKDLGVQSEPWTTIETTFDPKIIHTPGNYVVKIIGKNGEEKVEKEIQIIVNPLESVKNTFHLGYWQNYGLVLEGQIKGSGFDQASKTSYTKTIDLVDGNGKVILSKAVVNTNWYDSTQFDSYQGILNYEAIKELPDGDYTLQTTMLKDGHQVAKAPIQIPVLRARSILNVYEKDYTKIPKNYLGEHQLTPIAIQGKAGLHVEWRPQKVTVNLLTDRTNKEHRVIDAFILDSSFDFEQAHTKELTIKDASGKEVYRKSMATWDMSKWKTSVPNIQKHAGFQAVIPKEYLDTRTYTYEVKYSNEDNQSGEVKLDI